jgi:hypothetical protein
MTTGNVQPLLVLQARAEARAILYADGDYLDINDAIKPLMAYAFQSGIVDQIGAERAHAIIKAAFASAVEDGVSTPGGVAEI